MTRARSDEMARGAARLYAPGALLVYLSLLLPHPGANDVALLAVATLAAGVAAALTSFGRRLPPAAFPLLVTLGSGLVTILVFSGGMLGAAFACLYVWAATYAWYFLDTRSAAVQTSICVIACLAAGVTGQAAWLLVLMVVGTLLTVSLWVRHAVVDVRRQAVTDGLTGAPNRRAWDRLLAESMVRARRAGRPLTVAMLDLDHFKRFNDENGHPSGDLLLQTAVRIWQAGLRATDVVARYGGEEFAFLLEGCATEPGWRLIEDLRSLVPRDVTCSAGIAEWDHEESADTLMLRADSALYDAKRQGRDRCVVARSPALEALPGSTQWTRVAIRVMHEGRVRVFYQPVVNLGDRRVIGYEALARPDEALTGGSVDGLFSAAQRMGMTREIDYLCRRSALEGARTLPATIPLFINISIAALLDAEHDPDQMLFLLQLTGRRSHNIVLEISERESVRDLVRFTDTIAAYRDAGFKFAVDDVGEGHSTFETLAASTPEYVKLAASFIRRLEEPGPRAAVIAACSFARETGADVIAEGIEAEPAIGVLRELGIALGQGYHLGRPCSLDAEDGAAPVLIPGVVGGWR